MGKVFGREPAVIVAAFGAFLQLLVAFGVGVSPLTQSVFTAVVAAVLGVYVAIKVHDGVYPAVAGLVQAGVALASHFWLHWSAEDQAKNLALVMVIVAALFVRPAVTAPVGPEVSPAGKLVV